MFQIFPWNHFHENFREIDFTENSCFLFQDCNDWGDNTTAVTGLSDLAFPPESMGKWGEDLSPTESIDYDGWRFICQRYMGAWTAAALSILAFFSPILMVILPQMDFVGLSKDQKKCKVMRYLIGGNHDIQCSTSTLFLC